MGFWVNRVFLFITEINEAIADPTILSLLSEWAY